MSRTGSGMRQRPVSDAAMAARHRSRVLLVEREGQLSAIPGGRHGDAFRKQVL